MSKPVAVCISDIHFNIKTIYTAEQALHAALTKAEKLNVPLIIAGDLHDTKAIIRAEVAYSLIHLLKLATVKVYIIVGNHDLVNEKAAPHGLEYLAPYATIVDQYNFRDLSINTLPSASGMYLIPYSNDIINSIAYLPEHARLLVMHQGFLGAAMGDYIQDKSSISPDLVKEYTVISGHYHRHQTIGTVTYIGSPYTITFGEANDGPKGFLVLNEDGTFTREILDLRKHIILERHVDDLQNLDLHFNTGNGPRIDDLVWLKISGPLSQLQKLNKEEIGLSILGHQNFKLELLPDPSPDQIRDASVAEAPQMTDTERMDSIISNLSDKEEHKQYLKELYREVIVRGS